MHKVEASVRAFRTTHGIANKKVLLMVSGGVDSMVLLHSFAAVHPTQLLHVLHINHNTQTENKRDEMLVRHICAQQNISCTVHLLTHKPTKNKEAQWRNARLEKSKQIASETSCEHILTAHHATDLVETVLLRLIKGSGIMGLSPHEKSTKPLYSCTKIEIYEYAEQNKVRWNEDATNTDRTFDRNRIRQSVVPELKVIAPNLEKTFVRNAEIAEEYYAFVQSQLPISEGNSIPLAAFQGFHILLQKEWLRQKSRVSISTGELLDALKWLQSPRGMTKKIIGSNLFSVKKGVLYWNETAG